MMKVGGIDSKIFFLIYCKGILHAAETWWHCAVCKIEVTQARGRCRTRSRPRKALHVHNCKPWGRLRNPILSMEAFCRRRQALYKPACDCCCVWPAAGQSWSGLEQPWASQNYIEGLLHAWPKVHSRSCVKKVWDPREISIEIPALSAQLPRYHFLLSASERLNLPCNLASIDSSILIVLDKVSNMWNVCKLHSTSAWKIPALCTVTLTIDVGM